MKKTTIECLLEVKTKGGLQLEKPIAGRLRVNEEMDEADFWEEEGATVIYGEPNTKRLMQGNHCSVWWNKKKKRYVIRVTCDPNYSPVIAECDFENCMNFIKRRICNGTETY